MEKYCNSCRQSYVSEQSCCPACGDTLMARLTGESRHGSKPDATPLPSPLQAQAATDRDAAHAEHEVDLGSPVSAGQSETGGPPSGASFVSWSARQEQKQRLPTKPAPEPAVQFDPPSAAQLPLASGRLPPCPPEPQSASSGKPDAASASGPEALGGETTDAEVDLGRPVTEQTDASGPLSGASGVGWAALLRARKNYEDPNHPTLDYHNPEPSAPPGGAGPQPADGQQRRELAAPPTVPNAGGVSQLRGVALGFLLGVGACFALWLLGCEPPQSWRQWLGRAAPQSPAPLAPGGGPALEAGLPP